MMMNLSITVKPFRDKEDKARECPYYLTLKEQQNTLQLLQLFHCTASHTTAKPATIQTISDTLSIAAPKFNSFIFQIDLTNRAIFLTWVF